MSAAPRMIIVVPARGGSKRVPRKNVRPLAGRSLLARTDDAIRASGIGAPVLLTTDDREIAESGRSLGWQIVDRPDHLADDMVPTEPAILHALDAWEAGAPGTADWLMMLQPTSPFRDGGCLRQAVDLLTARDDADAVVGIAALHVGARHVHSLGPDGVLAPLGDDGTRTYVPNGALYLIRTAALRKHGTFYPPRTLGLEMGRIASLDIDTEDDWCMAEALLSLPSGQEQNRP